MAEGSSFPVSMPVHMGNAVFYLKHSKCGLFSNCLKMEEKSKKTQCKIIYTRML